ncbi:MAG: type II secretion system protein [Nitrospiraceae bacterium]|nr:type II secretion system protein [Nitrospiraceae bacterium]
MLQASDDNRGFTMIEMIAVLVIIGILAAVAISRAMGTSEYSLASESGILKNNLRFAQIKAMGDIAPDTWGIHVSSGSYTLVCTGANCPAATPDLPGDNSPTHTFAGGVTASPAAVNFDTWGSPGGSAATITLTGGSQTAAVTVTANTGFVK